MYMRMYEENKDALHNPFKKKKGKTIKLLKELLSPFPKSSELTFAGILQT